MKNTLVEIHASLDVADLDLAVDIAQMAAAQGVSVLEVGTPLLYIYGYKSIDRIREAVPDSIKIVADFKAKDCCETIFMQARRHGADLACVMGYNNDAGIAAAAKAKKTCGIRLIADMFSVPVPEMAQAAKRAAKMGADVILIHMGGDENELGLSAERKEYDGVLEVAQAVDIPVAAVCDIPGNAVEAVRRGATWLVFGLCLRNAKAENEKACQEYVEAVRRAVSKE